MNTDELQKRVEEITARTTEAMIKAVQKKAAEQFKVGMYDANKRMTDEQLTLVEVGAGVGASLMLSELQSRGFFNGELLVDSVLEKLGIDLEEFVRNTHD